MTDSTQTTTEETPMPIEWHVGMAEKLEALAASHRTEIERRLLRGDHK